MGAICAVVYLLVIIVFIPFPFYKDIVAATSGGGNRDVVLELEQIQTGRFLHRFPHSKVGMTCAHGTRTPRTLTDLVRSWPRTCRPSCPSNPSFSSGSEMICSTSDGVTRF